MCVPVHEEQKEKIRFNFFFLSLFLFFYFLECNFHFTNFSVEEKIDADFIVLEIDTHSQAEAK